MNKLRIRFIFIMLLVISIIGSGCQSLTQSSVTTDSTEGSQCEITYTITLKDRIYYLNFSDGNDISTPNTDIGLQSFDLKFQSLEEMKEVFLNNQLSKTQIETMKIGFPKNDNGIMIANMNELYEPTIPIELTLGDICLNGLSYSFSFEPCDASTDPMSGFVSILPQSIYDRNYLTVLANLYKEHINSLTQENITDRNATVYEYSTQNSEKKLINYDIMIGNKTLHISEHYTVSWHADYSIPGQLISDSIPSHIQIFGCENGQYFEVGIYGISERPSVEWLSSFGITEYIGSNATVEK